MLGRWEREKASILESQTLKQELEERVARWVAMKTLSGGTASIQNVPELENKLGRTNLAG